MGRGAAILITKVEMVTKAELVLRRMRSESRMRGRAVVKRIIMLRLDLAAGAN